jgi:hypothetical protein
MRHKKYTGGSNPSSGQSSPKTGQLDKRRSYTTDDIDLISGSSSSVDGVLKKSGGSVKPKGKELRQFAFS